MLTRGALWQVHDTAGALFGGQLDLCTAQSHRNPVGINNYHRDAAGLDTGGQFLHDLVPFGFGRAGTGAVKFGIADMDHLARDRQDVCNQSLRPISFARSQPESQSINITMTTISTI